MSLGQKSLFILGCVQGAIISLVCLCLSVCVTFVVFTDRESCTRPASTNSGSMETGEYGLTRRKCFLAYRLELDAVAGLLWISWCVLGGAGFFCVFFFSICFYFFERTQPAASMRPPCLIYLSTSNEERPSGRSDRGRFCLGAKQRTENEAKKPLHTGVRTGCLLYTSPSPRD